MEKKPMKAKAAQDRDVADKLIKVNTETHRLLKIKAAKAGRTIGNLLNEFAKAK